MNARALPLLIAALRLADGLHAAETVGTRPQVEQLQEQLPGMSALTESELRQFVPGEYVGDAKLYLLPDGRYYYFVWSESGPNTKYYDTGRWTIAEGLTELAANPANVLLKTAGKSFLILKAPRDHAWIEAYAIEMGDPAERFKAAASTLREKAASMKTRGANVSARIQGLFQAQFSLRREVASERSVGLLPSFLDAQNRVAASRPSPADRLAEFQERARQYVPTATGIRSATVAEVEGHYHGSWGMGGCNLFLLPDGGYYFGAHDDLPTFTTAYEEGKWSVRDGVVELISFANVPHAPAPPERRFFVMRAPLPADRGSPGSTSFGLSLVGTVNDAGRFLSFSVEMEAAVAATNANSNLAVEGKSASNYTLGSFGTMRFAEPISIKETAVLREQFDAENRADAAARNAEQPTK